jgi:hypothetical protein
VAVAMVVVAIAVAVDMATSVHTDAKATMPVVRCPWQARTYCTWLACCQHCAVEGGRGLSGAAEV